MKASKKGSFQVREARGVAPGCCWFFLSYVEKLQQARNIMRYSKDHQNLLLSEDIERKLGEIRNLCQSVITDLLSFIPFLAACDISSAYFSRLLKTATFNLISLKTPKNFIWKCVPILTDFCLICFSYLPQTSSMYLRSSSNRLKSLWPADQLRAKISYRLSHLSLVLFLL